MSAQAVLIAGIKSSKDLDQVAVACPICDGQRVIRGPQTSIIWFGCGYCEGTGQVSQGRFKYWYDHHFRERPNLFETERTERTATED